MDNAAEAQFLNLRYIDNITLLKDAINGKDIAFWDNILITTATRVQAELYSRLLQSRRDEGFLPARTKIFVEADRNDERIGSGGSTLCALTKLYGLNGGISKLLNQKTLILHSGGDAKRMPHSAPFGKLFALSGSCVWGEVQNPPAAIFDDLMVSFAGIPSRMNGGVVVVSADAFFRFDDTQIDLDTADSVAFAMRAPVSEGAKHGVFLEKSHNGFVAQFLHKLSESELQVKGAVSEHNVVDLDIGITYLGADAIAVLVSLVVDDTGDVDEQKLACYANDTVRLSFYGDIIYPMAEESTLESYMAQEGDVQLTDALLSLRPGLYQKLHKCHLRLCRLSPGKIQNMGTTLEAIETMRFLDVDNLSLISKRMKSASVGVNCFIENSSIEAEAKIGENCLISNCEVDSSMNISDNIALHCLKLTDGRWVCRVWGVLDDIKSDTTWINRKFYLSDWDKTATSLWNAHLFPVCADRHAAIRWAEKLIRGNLNVDEMNEWRYTARLSLADVQNIDLEWLLQSRAANEDSVRTDAFAQCVLNGKPPKQAVGILGVGQHACRRIALLINKAGSLDINHWQKKMRLFHCIAEAIEILEICDFDVQSLREKGLAALREATETSTPKLKTIKSAKWKIKFAETSLPIRVNFGGTWSDAPPYCFECGGTMLNAAVALGGNLPIYVSAEVTDEPLVRFINMQFGAEVCFAELEPLLSFSDPSDLCILFKAALSIAGIINAQSGTLEEQLKSLGGGVRITTDVDIPRGSGLGTSSIIEAGLIDVLYKLTGVKRTNSELSDDVLLAEQLMTTGGGWQDVIGGVYSGVKLTFTEPGIPQIYDVENVKLAEKTVAELNERGFLLYTGQRRLARSVLRRVVSNYICNHTESLEALNATQRLAVDLAYELRRGNVNAFGEMLPEHMRLLKQLDTSSSNRSLDYIMQGLSEFASGTTLCGAAGGGFLYGVLRDGYTISDIAEWNVARYNGCLSVQRAIIV